MLELDKQNLPHSVSAFDNAQKYGEERGQEALNAYIMREDVNLYEDMPTIEALEEEWKNIREYFLGKDDQALEQETKRIRRMWPLLHSFNYQK